MKTAVVNEVLETHNGRMKEYGIRYKYILELVIQVTDLSKKIGHKVSYQGGYYLRLKGRNGEIIMHQEMTSYVNARRVAAKLLDEGELLAKYKETKIKRK
jgi:hypothetical protein